MIQQFTRRTQIVGVLYIAAFVGVTYGFGIYIFAQLIPEMSGDLGFSNATAGLITSIGQLGFVVFALAGTWAASRSDPVVVMVGSVALCSICVLLVPIAPSVLLLGLLLFVSVGTSASVYIPIAEVVAAFTAPTRRGVSLGVISSGTTYGVGASAAMIPVLVPLFSWRAVWLVSGLLGLALAAVAWRFLNASGVRAEVLRLRRSTASAGGSHAMNWRVVGSLLVTWAGLIWIVKMMNGVSFMSFQTFLSPLLVDVGGSSIRYSSMIWLIIAICGAAAGFLVGALADKVGLRRTLIGCYVAFFCASMLLTQVQSGFVPVVAAVLFAFAFYPVYGLVPAYVSTIASGQKATVIFGLANVFQGAGGIIGNSASGAIIATSGTDAVGLPLVYWFVGLGSFVLFASTVFLPDDRAVVRVEDDRSEGSR